MYTLDKETRHAIDQYMKRVGTLNGTENYNSPFDVTPAVEQKIIDQYNKQTDFLKRVNILQVKNGHGQKLGLGSNKSVASTTDTKTQDRQPVDIYGVEGVDEYLCTKTNFDIALYWEIIDSWGHLSNFQKRCAKLVVQTIAQDKQRIGFNGVKRSPTSDRVANPLLQDVNIGWLEKMRLNNSQRVIKDEVVGASKEFKTLDALVESAVHELIGENHRNGGDLVAISSANLVQDKYIGLLNQTHEPTEQQASKALYQTKRLGTLPVDTPSFFVPNGLLITSYDNLSIYIQKGTHRRYFKDEPERDRTVDFHSMNECFVIEDYSKAVLFDNLTVEK